jgi:dolichyl-phosphate beta-glucosyltransferase
MQNRKISVVVPCFNEGKTIYENIKIISEYLSVRFFDWEIIAVNDGSRDNTCEEIRLFQKNCSKVRLIDNAKNEGKGKAVRDGILNSQNEIVMFMDADLAIPIECVDKFIAEIENGYHLVIASRFIPGLKVLEPVLPYRKFMEKVFWILRILIINNYKVKDTQCGFKVFSRKAALDIFSKMTVKRFAFDAEIIFIADNMGYEVKELPIILQNPAISSIRIYSDSINMFLDLIKIRLNSITGKYNKRKSVPK